MNCISNLAKNNIKHYKTNNRLVTISIILSTCLITVIGILCFSIQSMILETTIERQGDSYCTFSNISDKQLQMLRNNEKVEKIGEYIDFGYIKDNDINKIKSSLFYTDDLGAEMMNIKLERGSLPKGSKELAVEEWVLKSLNIKPEIGQTISLKYNSKENEGIKEDTFILSGILKDDKVGKIYNNSRIIISKEYALNNLSNDSIVKNAMVRTKGKFNIIDKVKEVAQSVGIKNEQMQVNNVYIKALGGDISVIIPFAIITVVVVFATAVVIYNIFYISIIERIKQFGLLRAVGATKKQIKKIVFKEGVRLSVIGIPIGIITGHILGFWLIPALSNNSIHPKFSIIIIIISTSVGILTIIASLIKPQRAASRISPIEAMRYDSYKTSIKKKSRKSSGKIDIKRMAYFNLWRNKKRTLITMLSLIMSGVLFIVFSSMLEIEKMNKENLTEQKIECEFSLNIKPEVDDTGDPLSKDMISKISSIKGIKSIGTVKYSSQVFLSSNEDKKENLACSIYGYNDIIFKNLNKKLLKGSISLDKLKNGDEVLVVCKKEDINKYKIGDKVQLAVKLLDSSGKLVGNKKTQFTIGGIVSEETSYLGERPEGPIFITHEDGFNKIIENGKILGAYITIDNKEFDYIKSELETIVKKDNRIDISSYTEFKKEQEQEFKGIEIAAMSLVGVIALIGMLNLINTMITSILSRKKELAMLQAIGLSSNQMKKMLQIEGLYYAVTSAVISILVGTTLGYFIFVLVKKIADYAEYKFPLVPIILVVIVFTTIQVTLTYWVEKRLRKDSIVDRIRYND